MGEGTGVAMKVLRNLDFLLGTELIRLGLKILGSRQAIVKSLQKLIPTPEPKIIYQKGETKADVQEIMRVIHTPPWRDKKGHKWISTKRGTACEFCLRLLTTGANDPCD